MGRRKRATTGTTTTTRTTTGTTSLHPEIEVYLREVSKLEEFRRGDLSLVRAWRPESEDIGEDDFDAIVQDHGDGRVLLMREHDQSSPPVDGLVLIRKWRWAQMKEAKGLALDMLAMRGVLRRR